MKFYYKNIHSCDAAVLRCVDFRFWDNFDELLKQKFNIKSYDLWCLPGAGKIFLDKENQDFADTLLEKIKNVSIKLHNIKELIILNHQDCGGYGGRKAFLNIEDEFNKHKTDLLQVRNILQEKLPNIKIRIGLITLDEQEEEFDIIEF